ncbi:SMARCA4_1 [Blepharisma stoltei]|uniref:Uncharacterized protein n=1 Tax=Blepharisma stoltei TaxID=1481888 RepID=A0AAU9IX84_9CILI|nr:unnamed protein product [Blepharisma stoltei]
MSFSVPKYQISPLPSSLKFTPQQFEQLKHQIQSYTILNRGQELSQVQIQAIQGIKLQAFDSYQTTGYNTQMKTKYNHSQDIKEKSNSQLHYEQEPKSITFFYENRAKLLEKFLQSDLDEDTKNRILTEKFLIELRDLQNQTRSEVIKEWKEQPDNNYDQSHRLLETTLLDRDFFKRNFPMFDFRAKQENRMLGRYDYEMRNGQDTKRKNQQMIFLSEVLNHQQDFFDFHRRNHANLRKNIYGGKGYLDYLDRQEKAKRDKDEKERLKALKDNNMEIYVDLLAKTKNERLLKILQQTDSFLREIGAKVLLQKGDNEAEIVEQAPEAQSAGEIIADSLKKSSKMYYEITHAVVEEIKTQPENIEGGMLKSYQLIGLQWLVSLYNNNLHGILADEMGLGKTIQTIALFQYLIDNKNNEGPFLVVVPLSVLSNWVMEFKKWAPKIKFIVYKGPPIHRKKLVSNVLTMKKFNVLITTYEYIIKDKQQLSKIAWSYIVVDEGHRMKNSKSKFAQILGLQYSSDHRILLTGTPLQNNLNELWSLLNFLLPKIFHTLDDFEKWFNIPFSKIPGEQVELTEEESLLLINRLHQVLRPFLLRRVKKDVEKELPDKVEFVLKVELSSWQKKLYKDIQEKAFFNRDGGPWRCKSLNNSVMQLRKVCNHPYLFLHYEQLPMVTDEIWRCSGKFETLDRMLPKFIRMNHRVLIFTQMTHLMDIMSMYFEYRGFKYLRLDGTTKPEDRDLRMMLFNSENSEYYIFLLSTRAGGLGLNLQTADTVIIYDSDWNPQMDLQAQDRAHRLGQMKEVRVYRLVTNTKIEEAILTKAAYKKDVDAKVIQAGLFNTKSTELERNEKLRNLLKAEENEESEDETEFLTTQQLNEIISRNDEEYQIYEQMDAEMMKNENYKERLIQGDKLPFWLETHEEEINLDQFMYGRGMRRHKELYYREEIELENQYLGMKRVGSPIEDEINKRAKSSSESEAGIEIGGHGTKITISSGKMLGSNESSSETSIQDLEEDEVFKSGEEDEEDYENFNN